MGATLGGKNNYPDQGGQGREKKLRIVPFLVEQAHMQELGAVPFCQRKHADVVGTIVVYFALGMNYSCLPPLPALT